MKGTWLRGKRCLSNLIYCLSEHSSEPLLPSVKLIVYDHSERWQMDPILLSLGLPYVEQLLISYNRKPMQCFEQFLS